jgi:hypothetical protein
MRYSHREIFFANPIEKFHSKYEINMSTTDIFHLRHTLRHPKVYIESKNIKYSADNDDTIVISDNDCHLGARGSVVG